MILQWFVLNARCTPFRIWLKRQLLLWAVRLDASEGDYNDAWFEINREEP